MVTAAPSFSMILITELLAKDKNIFGDQCIKIYHGNRSPTGINRILWAHFPETMKSLQKCHLCPSDRGWTNILSAGNVRCQSALSHSQRLLYTWWIFQASQPGVANPPAPDWNWGIDPLLRRTAKSLRTAWRTAGTLPSIFMAQMPCNYKVLVALLNALEYQIFHWFQMILFLDSRQTRKDKI